MNSPSEPSKDLTIDLETAKEIVRQPDAHDFGAYSQITDEAAEFISKYDGDSISLNGLTELSATAAESLSKFQGECIGHNGLTGLSDAAAEALSRYRGDLILCNMRKISDAA